MVSIHDTREYNPGTGGPLTFEWPFESVIVQYNLLQFLDGMASVATQQVESPSSLMAVSGAAMKNVWWLGDKRMMELVHNFPPETEWKGQGTRVRRAPGHGYHSIRRDTIDALNKPKGDLEGLISGFNTDVGQFLKDYGG